jgi:hypothetical protein
VPISGASLFQSLAVPRGFRRHFAAFLLVNLALTGANIAMGAPWWAFWPLAVWGLPLVVHYLIYKTSTIDDAWVEERTSELHGKSYDFSHIADIQRKPTPERPVHKVDDPPA